MVIGHDIVDSHWGDDTVVWGHIPYRDGARGMFSYTIYQRTILADRAHLPADRPFEMACPDASDWNCPRNLRMALGT
jgi:hypothetical protein